MEYVTVLDSERVAVTRVPNRVSYSLPISKLRGVPYNVRALLKLRRITTCQQLLRAAGRVEDREALARASGIDLDVLTRLVERADMARVNGVGAIFGMMLEDLDVCDVGALAAREPRDLHEALRDYNGRERLARRSPTPEEVIEWVVQARALPAIVTH